jgi:hypothetical protein
MKNAGVAQAKHAMRRARSAQARKWFCMVQANWHHGTRDSAFMLRCT